MTISYLFPSNKFRLLSQHYEYVMETLDSVMFLKKTDILFHGWNSNSNLWNLSSFILASLETQLFRIYPAHPKFRGWLEIWTEFMYNICKLSLPKTLHPFTFQLLSSSWTCLFFLMPNRQTGFFLDFNKPASPDKDLHPDYKLFKGKDLHTLHLGISCCFET